MKILSSKFKSKKGGKTPINDEECNLEAERQKRKKMLEQVNIGMLRPSIRYVLQMMPKSLRKSSKKEDCDKTMSYTVTEDGLMVESTKPCEARPRRRSRLESLAGLERSQEAKSVRKTFLKIRV